jgi:hypothetical protein
MILFKKTILKEIDKQIQIREIARKMVLEYKTGSILIDSETTTNEMWRGYDKIEGALQALQALREFIK